MVPPIPVRRTQRVTQYGKQQKYDPIELTAMITPALTQFFYFKFHQGQEPLSGCNDNNY